MNQWMQDNRVQEILFDQTTKDRGLYNIKFIENLFKKRNDDDIYDFNGKKIWMILNLELWMREFID